jgi:hypothetical protein
MGNIDFYDLFYRNYTNYTDIKRAVIDCLKEKKDASTDTKYAVKECLYKLKTIESNDFDEIKFSDVTYTKFPIFDEDNNYSGGNFVPVFLNKKKNIDPVEYMNRLKKFEINNLPFIDVAEFLGIKVKNLPI